MKRLCSLDLFRLVAALLVVAIHTSPLSSFNADADFFLTRVLARVAVPFFLMVTGYFVLPDYIYGPFSVPKSAFRYAISSNGSNCIDLDKQGTNSQYLKIQKYLRKTLLLYGFSILLYLPVGIYAGHFRDISTISAASLWKILKMLLFDGTFYHLWYFPAGIMGIMLLLILRRYMSPRPLAITVVILYLIGLLGDSYYGLLEHMPVLLKIYQFFFQISSYTRNGIFFAPIFLLLGTKIGAAQSPGSIATPKHTTAKQGELLYFGFLVCFFVVSFSVMTLEAFTLHHLGLQRHDSMYLALIPVMFFLMKALLSSPDWFCHCFHSQNQNRPIASKQAGKTPNYAYLRPITTWIYILHPLMIIVLRGIAKATHQTTLLVDNSLVHYIGVCVLSVAASSGIYYLFDKKLSFSKFRIPDKCRSFWQRPCQKTSLQMKKGRAWIELDMAALRRNVLFLQSQLPQNSRLMPVVKADAYGHGAVLIAKELQEIGICAYCVATLHEGIRLRQNGIRGEILVLGYTDPAQLSLLLQHHLTQTIVDYAYAKQLASIYNNMQNPRKIQRLTKKQYQSNLHVHIGIDTGMHRLGERSEHLDNIIEIFQMNAFQIDGIFTHLATSDIKEPEGIAFLEMQKQEFSNVIAALEQQGIRCPPIHYLASYGALGQVSSNADKSDSATYNSHLICSADTYGSYTRIGIALYGLLSTKQDTSQWQAHLQPVLSLKARVSSVRSLYKGESAGYGLQFISDRDRTIATLAIGYADGLPRSLSNQKGFVLIHGYKAPIIGLICMDMTLVDVTDIPNVCAGDIAVIIGKSGNLECSAGDLAACAGTITNDVLSRLGARLERVIKDGYTAEHQNLQ